MDQEALRYRVVYRRGDQTQLLGHITGVPASYQALDLFLSRLLLAGIQHGELLLVEATTRRIVVHRAVRPFKRRASRQNTPSQ